MEGTEVPPWLELIPVEIPAIGQAVFFDQRFDVANIINPARDRDPDLVGVAVAACVGHGRRLRFD